MRHFFICNKKSWQMRLVVRGLLFVLTVWCGVLRGCVDRKREGLERNEVLTNRVMGGAVGISSTCPFSTYVIKTLNVWASEDIRYISLLLLNHHTFNKTNEEKKFVSRFFVLCSQFIQFILVDSTLAGMVQFSRTSSVELKGSFFHAGVLCFLTMHSFFFFMLVQLTYKPAFHNCTSAVVTSFSFLSVLQVLAAHR